MPKADSKKRKSKQIRQIIPVMGLKALTTTIKVNIMADSATPMIQANFFCFAPTYSGVCRETMSRPTINDGENFGLMKTLIIKSVKKNVITYLIGTKLLSNMMNMNERKVARKR